MASDSDNRDELVTVRFDCPTSRLADIPKILEALSDDSVELALPVKLRDLVRRIEEMYIRRALKESGGNVAGAARLLGMKRTALAERRRRKSR